MKATQSAAAVQVSVTVDCRLLRVCVVPLSVPCGATCLPGIVATQSAGHTQAQVCDTCSRGLCLAVLPSPLAL